VTDLPVLIVHRSMGGILVSLYYSGVIVRSYGTAGSMVLCIHMILQSIFATTFLI
jgi:hypothetical protein